MRLQKHETRLALNRAASSTLLFGHPITALGQKNLPFGQCLAWESRKTSTFESEVKVAPRRNRFHASRHLPDQDPKRQLSDQPEAAHCKIEDSPTPCKRTAASGRKTWKRLSLFWERMITQIFLLFRGCFCPQYTRAGSARFY